MVLSVALTSGGVVGRGGTQTQAWRVSLALTPLSSSREVEGPQVLRENVAGPGPWEERFVLMKVELIS